MRPGDCRNCGWGEFAHDSISGTCLWGGEGEDATGYERAGIRGAIRAMWRTLMWRWRFRAAERMDWQ
jgi:hypothetical protein